jgi:hypothetical protein
LRDQQGYRVEWRGVFSGSKTEMKLFEIHGKDGSLPFFAIDLSGRELSPDA